MTIVHSCCPEKRNIYAPTFVKTETLTLTKGSIEVFECQGCKTVIMLERMKDEPSND